MRSPGNAPRVAAEWALRVIALALLVMLVLRVSAPARDVRGVAQVRSSGLDAALRGWTLAPPAAAHVELDSVPAPVERDWIAALRRAGMPVTWSGATIAPVATSLARVADPVATWDLAVAAPRGAHVVVSDAVGPLDSAVAGVGGVRLSVPGLDRHVVAALPHVRASAVPGDSVVLRRVLVEGSAGWETKYTIAALAERGWGVDAITHVAPGVDVRLGDPSRPDTARYAAIVAVDTSASLVASGAGAFVRNGGGLVTLRDAAGIGPGTGAGIVLERRGDGDVRAYRVGRGRVIRVGYKDLWRRRMTNDDTVPDPVAAHRAWVASVVSSVAYAPRVAVSASDTVSDPAPVADVVERMGASSVAPVVHTSVAAGVSTWVLFTLLVMALLLEWLSRRMRGAR
jgi:hypothetical protein